MNYEKLRNKILSNPEAKMEYDLLEPEFQIVEAIISARQTKRMSQQDLANVTGIDRADISKIENANANPTIETLNRLAEGLGKKLIIQFK